MLCADCEGWIIYLKIRMFHQIALWYDFKEISFLVSHSLAINKNCLEAKMLKLLGKFGRAKRNIVMLAVCLAITVAVSFHDDIFFGKRNTTSTSTTITQADSPSKT